jgi:hypothetical protein
MVSGHLQVLIRTRVPPRTGAGGALSSDVGLPGCQVSGFGVERQKNESGTLDHPV